jgi:hypothetical protein
MSRYRQPKKTRTCDTCEEIIVTGITYYHEPRFNHNTQSLGTCRYSCEDCRHRPECAEDGLVLFGEDERTNDTLPMMFANCG